MSTTVGDAATVIGVGLDTARYGHRATFLGADRQMAAAPLDVPESRAGYQKLQRELERLRAHYPQARFHIRLDAAGQYAVNLEQFLRSLPLPIELSIGQPARNAAYRKVHYPKRKADVTDSLATARFAVVEQPPETPGTAAEFLVLREVSGQLESQVKQTTRLVNQLHNVMARVFPELALLASDLGAKWVLTLLTEYPTAQRIARARVESLAKIPYLSAETAVELQQAARDSVGTLSGEIVEALVRQAVEEIRLSNRLEERQKKLLTEAYLALPEGNHKLLTTIPGIGAVTAAAIVAKVVDINRFDTPAKLVSYFGVFPEENTSGYDKRGRPVLPGTMQMSPQGNDLVRRCLWLAAMSAARHNPAVRSLYARQRSRGKRGDVALGHCMRKLLHLVFALWKTGKEFNPQHYPWEPEPSPEAQEPAPSEKPASADGQVETKTAAGHKREKLPTRKVVTATASSVTPPEAAVHGAESSRPALDYAAVRAGVTMEQALDRLGWLAQLTGHRPQLRGPCPIHGSAEPGHRSFSVNLERQVFRCFDPGCAAQGNVLDLWSAVHQLPLYEAATHLNHTFGLTPHDQPAPPRTSSKPQNREEEPVTRPRQPR